MKKNLLLISAFFIVAGGALTFLLKNSETEANPKIVSEKKRVKRSNFDKPNEFIEYFNLIKGQLGEKPQYKTNYRFDELAKAKKSTPKKSDFTVKWVERGPGNVGGRTRSLIIDPTDPTTNWIAGGVSGGIWQTKDAGASWTNLTPNLPNLGITALASSKSNSKVIYAGTGEGFGNSGGIHGDGLFVSTQGGAVDSWKQVASTAGKEEFAFVNEILVHPTDVNTILVATNTGVYKTTNAGGDWTEVLKVTQGSYVSRIQSMIATTAFDGIYVGGNSFGVYKSVDGGDTWARVYEAKSDERRFGLALAPSNEDRVYIVAVVGSGEDSYGAYYTTIDAGVSWSRVIEGEGNSDNFLGEQGWYDLATVVNPFDENELFIGGVYVGKIQLTGKFLEERQVTKVVDEGTLDFIEYINFGASDWGSRLQNEAAEGGSGKNITMDDLKSIEIRFGDGLTQKAHRFTIPADAGANGDGGGGVSYDEYVYADYVDVPFQVWDTDNNVQLMVSFRDNEGNGEFDLIMRDDNAGNKAREYLFVHAVEYDAVNSNPDISKDAAVTEKLMYFMWPTLNKKATWDAEKMPTAKLVITAGDVKIPISSASVISNSRSSKGPEAHLHADHHIFKTIVLDEAKKSFAILNGNDGGLGYSVDNGTTWRQVPDDSNKGYNTTQFYGADKKPGEDVYFGGMQDNGTWMSSENPTELDAYSFELGGDGFEVLWHAKDPDLLIGGAYNNLFSRSIDGGKTWEFIGAQLQEDGPFISRLSSSDVRPNHIFAVGTQGVWKSTNFGKSWSVISITESWGKIGSNVVRVSGANPDYIWAGGGMIDEDFRLHLSTDGGRSFSPVNNFSGKNKSAISNIAPHPLDKETAYVLFSQRGEAKIVKTTDAGESWTDITKFTDGVSQNGFPDVAVYSLFVFPIDVNRIWAGTEIGLVESTDGGETWAMADNGFPNVSIWQMKERDHQLVVATHGRGIWTADFEKLALSSEILKSETTLKVFPNPAKEFVNVDLGVVAKGDVRISILDLNGKVVLDKQLTAAGSSTPIQLDVNSLESGQYILRAQIGQTVETRTVQIVK